MLGWGWGWGGGGGSRSDPGRFPFSGYIFPPSVNHSIILLGGIPRGPVEYPRASPLVPPPTPPHPTPRAWGYRPTQFMLNTFSLCLSCRSSPGYALPEHELDGGGGGGGGLTSHPVNLLKITGRTHLED